MENFSFNFTPDMFAIVFCVAAVVQMLKRIPNVAQFSDWFALLSCVLGIGSAFLMGFDKPVIAGMIIGMVASGSYSLVKGAAGEAIVSRVADAPIENQQSKIENK